jgi:hypothetical protein
LSYKIKFDRKALKELEIPLMKIFKIVYLKILILEIREAQLAFEILYKKK